MLIAFTCLFRSITILIVVGEGFTGTLLGKTALFVCKVIGETGIDGDIGVVDETGNAWRQDQGIGIDLIGDACDADEVELLQESCVILDGACGETVTLCGKITEGERDLACVIGGLEKYGIGCGRTAFEFTVKLCPSAAVLSVMNGEEEL